MPHIHLLKTGWKKIIKADSDNLRENVSLSVISSEWEVHSMAHTLYSWQAPPSSELAQQTESSFVRDQAPNHLRPYWHKSNGDPQTLQVNHKLECLLWEITNEELFLTSVVLVGRCPQSRFAEWDLKNLPLECGFLVKVLYLITNHPGGVDFWLGFSNAK